MVPALNPTEYQHPGASVSQDTSMIPQLDSARSVASTARPALGPSTIAFSAASKIKMSQTGAGVIKAFISVLVILNVCPVARTAQLA